jgi:hypothetical protein
VLHYVCNDCEHPKPLQGKQQYTWQPLMLSILSLELQTSSDLLVPLVVVLLLSSLLSIGNASASAVTAVGWLWQWHPASLAKLALLSIALVVGTVTSATDAAGTNDCEYC